MLTSKFPPRRRALADDDAWLGRLLRLHMQGLSQRDVAEDLGVSQRCVCSALKRLGIPPNGYRTRASRSKRSRATRDHYRLQRAIVPIPETWEREWPIVRGEVPPKLGFLLFSALSRLAVVAHGEPGVQILPQGERLLIRASPARLDEIAAKLPAGTTLRIGGSPCVLGDSRARPVRPATKLTSWCVTARGKMTAEDLRVWCLSELSRLGLECRVKVGERRVIKIKGKLVVGFEVMLTSLHPLGAERLMALGLGGRRRFGCGVFVAC